LNSQLNDYVDFICDVFTGTVRSFLEHNRLGKYNPEEMKRKEEVKRQEMEADKTAAKIVKVGDRCEIRVPGQPVRRATVMFVGKMQKGIAFTFSVLNCNTSLRSSQLQ
jgi:tubulin-folding cofactor B